MSERVVVRLGDVADVRWGDTSTTKASYVPNGHVAYSASGPDGYLPHADYTAKGIVLSAIGAKCGQVWLAKGAWSCIKNTIRILEKDSDACIEYLYWHLLLTHPWPKRGSAQPFISQQDARSVPISLPPLDEQRAVAQVLGALDDKIAVNDHLGGKYEALLRLYFADLRMDTEPSTSEVLVSELIELNPRTAISTGGDAAYLDMGALPTSSARVTSWSRRPPKSGARFRNGDTVMARITPCLENGKVAFVDFLDDGEVGVGSTEFIVLRARPGVPTHLPYFLARSPRFRAHAIQNMSGSSGRQRVGANSLAPFPLSPPDASRLERFGESAAAAFAHMKSLDTESRYLRELRDTLLPRLMSGEVRVREAEELVEDAT